VMVRVRVMVRIRYGDEQVKLIETNLYRI
jgi:hypothetical protein